MCIIKSVCINVLIDTLLNVFIFDFGHFGSTYSQLEERIKIK